MSSQRPKFFITFVIGKSKTTKFRIYTSRKLHKSASLSRNLYLKYCKKIISVSQTEGYHWRVNKKVLTITKAKEVKLRDVFYNFGSEFLQKAKVVFSVMEPVSKLAVIKKASWTQEYEVLFSTWDISESQPLVIIKWKLVRAKSNQ